MISWCHVSYILVSYSATKIVAQNTLEIIHLFNTASAHQLIRKSCNSASWKRIFSDIKNIPRGNEILPAETKYSPRKWNVKIFPPTPKYSSQSKYIPRGREIIPRGKIIPRGPENIPRGKIFPAAQKLFPAAQKIFPAAQKIFPAEKIFPAAQKIFPAEKNIPRGPENIPRGKKVFFSMSLPGFRRYYSWDGIITWGMEISLAVNIITRGIELLLAGCIYYSRDEHITRGNKILLADKKYYSREQNITRG